MAKSNPFFTFPQYFSRNKMNYTTSNQTTNQPLKKNYSQEYTKKRVTTKRLKK